MSLIIKLRENRNFTHNERIVAIYIIKNLDKLIELNIEKISKETFVSKTCIIRMCKKIGFNGFKDFKLAMIEENEKIKKENLSFESSDIDDEGDIKYIIEKLSKLSVLALKENKILQKSSNIEKIIDLINKMRIIDFYGIGASYLVCLDGYYKFNKVGKIAIVSSEPDRQYVQAMNSNEEHIAILISYSGITQEIVNIARLLKNKKIPTVSITRYGKNTLATICDYNLYITSRESLIRSAAIYSRIAMLNLMDVLYVSYIKKYYKNDEIKIKK